MSVPLYLRVNAVMAALGIKRAAAAMGVSEGRAYKYGQPEDANGEPIPVTRLLRLIAAAANDDRKAVHDALSDLLCFLIPSPWTVISKALLERIRTDIDAIMSGKPPETKFQETLLVCKGCGDPLQVIAGAGGAYRFICRGCMPG